MFIQFEKRQQNKEQKGKEKKSGCLWHWVDGGKGGRTRNRSRKTKSRGRKSPGRKISIIKFVGELHLNVFYYSSNSWWSPLFLHRLLVSFLQLFVELHHL